MKQSCEISPDILLGLRKFILPEIVYGVGALELAGQHAINLGASKIFIVTDTGVRDAGWVEKVIQCLKNVGLTYVIFDGVTPNPKDYEVMAGFEVYYRKGCDLIMAVGGGSPMDCAKGIGVIAGNGGHILDYEGIDEVDEPGPPMIFIPTTAGTSADVSQFAIITDSTRKVKIAIISKMVIPDIALVDPETTITMDPELTASTGMDALCHAFESFVSTVASPLTDMAALTAVNLVVNNLPGAFHHPDEMVYRDHMMMASLMAGLAFSNASLGLVHAMAHSLGGMLGLAHGECNAILLEEVIRFNYPAAASRYDQLAEAMGLDLTSVKDEQRAVAVVNRVADFRKSLGIKQRLKDLGISRSDLSRLAQYASLDPCMATNPREAVPEEIEKIYDAVYE